MSIKNLQIDMSHTLSLSMDLILFIHDTGSFMHYNLELAPRIDQEVHRL